MIEWSWNAVPKNMTPEDAFKYCIENKIMTDDDRIRCDCVTYGEDGVGYAGPRYMRLEEIQRRGGILHWFAGWRVCWTDCVHHPERPIGDRPFEDHSQEVKDRLYRKFAWHRQFTGTLAEVKAFTSRRSDDGRLGNQ